MIKLDVSDYTTVVTCSSCAGWAELTGSRLEGSRVAAGHEERVHPQQTTARDNLGSLLRYAQQSQHAD